MPVNENQQTLLTLAEIYRELDDIQKKGEEIIFDPNIPSQQKMLFLIWYSFRLNQLKTELDEIEQNIHQFFLFRIFFLGDGKLCPSNQSK